MWTTWGCSLNIQQHFHKLLSYCHAIKTYYITNRNEKLYSRSIECMNMIYDINRITCGSRHHMKLELRHCKNTKSTFTRLYDLRHQCRETQSISRTNLDNQQCYQPSAIHIKLLCNTSEPKRQERNVHREKTLNPKPQDQIFINGGMWSILLDRPQCNFLNQKHLGTLQSPDLSFNNTVYK